MDDVKIPPMTSSEVRRQVEAARVIATGVVHRFVRRGDAIGAEDVEDLVSTTMVRLITRLKETERSSVHDISAYVARSAFNVVNDHFRTHFPERARVRNRLRYALSHDARLAIWTIRGQLAGGLASWSGMTRARGTAIALPAAVDRHRELPGDALVALFSHAGEPFMLDALIDMMFPLWRTSLPVEPAVAPAEPLALESREFLGSLWAEITQLGPLQRKALLLNLRDADTSCAIELFMTTGTADAGAIAAALEMTTGEFLALRDDLPLDDLRIASMLGLTRQRVIDLRRSARERLTRRLAHLRRP